MPAGWVLRRRARVVRAIRRWFHSAGFVEIEAPALVRSPALEEHLEALPAGDGWLHTSPEFALKRVLAATDLCRIFSITPCFRGEEWGPLHATEFTMLEWYRVGVDYRGIMEDTCGLLRAAAAAVDVTLPPVERMTVAQAFARFASQSPAQDPIERARLWVNDVEPQLQAPTLVMDYPADEAAFAEVRGAVAERFELYWRGVELANAFTELRDPEELQRRWRHSNQARAEAGRPPYLVDERLVQAVGQHPFCGGAALGLDRLVLLLLDQTDIRDVRVGG